MASQNEKPDSFSVSWLPSAEAAYFRSLRNIAAQDTSAAALVMQRLNRALSAIRTQPDVGTLAKRGVRRFPIPKTGHVIDYRVTRSGIRIIRRARQMRKS